VPRISPLIGPVLIVAAVVSVFVPRLLDYAFGLVFLAAAARGMWGFSASPVKEPSRSWWTEVRPAIGVGILGLFGGGAIAWGWITAARAAAGVVGLTLFAVAWAMPRQQRDTEAMGCAALLGLFALTGWLGLFPPYLEESIWPGNPAGRTGRGVGGYLMLWLAGLALVGAAFAGARQRGVKGASGQGWPAVAAAGGFGLWLGGALYWAWA
jgi:hypothetical protein